MVDGEEFALENPVAAALPFPDFDEVRIEPMFTAFRGDQREGELRPDDRDIGSQLEQKRDRPDVVFVRVGEHQGVDVVQPVFDVTQIRQNQVYARLVVTREQHSAVDE